MGVLSKGSTLFFKIVIQCFKQNGSLIFVSKKTEKQSATSRQLGCILVPRSKKQQQLTFSQKKTKKMSKFDLIVSHSSSISLMSKPEELCQYTKLMTLVLSNRQLTSLPPQIGHLSNLQCLCLDKNELTHLPAEIGQLTKLKELYLHHNQLTTLPNEIRHLTELQELILAHNRFSNDEKEHIKALLPDCKIVF